MSTEAIPADLGLPTSTPLLWSTVVRSTIVGVVAGFLAALGTAIVSVVLGFHFGLKIIDRGALIVGAWDGLVIGLLVYAVAKWHMRAGRIFAPDSGSTTVIGLVGSFAATIAVFAAHGKSGDMSIASYVIDLGMINIVLICVTVAFDTIDNVTRKSAIPH